MKKTFADKAARIQKRYPNHKRSKLEHDSMMEELTALAAEQEAMKAQMAPPQGQPQGQPGMGAPQMAMGGDTYATGGYVNANLYAEGGGTGEGSTASVNSGWTAEKVQGVIDHYATDAPITGEQLLRIANEKDFPIELAIAQGVQESHFGTKGRGKTTKNIYNVGNTDGGDGKAAKDDKFNQYEDSWESGIAGYMDLMIKDYLPKDGNWHSLLKSGNFKRHTKGGRYASAEGYEDALSDVLSTVGGMEGIEIEPLDAPVTKINNTAGPDDSPLEDEGELEIDDTDYLASLATKEANAKYKEQPVGSAQAAGPDPIDPTAQAIRQQLTATPNAEGPTELASVWDWDEEKSAEIDAYAGNLEERYNAQDAFMEDMKNRILTDESAYNDLGTYKDKTKLGKGFADEEDINPLIREIYDTDILEPEQKRELMATMNDAYDYRKRNKKLPTSEELETHRTDAGKSGVALDLDLRKAGQDIFNDGAQYDNIRPPSTAAGTAIGNRNRWVEQMMSTNEAGPNMRAARLPSGTGALRYKAASILSGDGYEGMSNQEKAQGVFDAGVLYDFMKANPGNKKPTTEDVNTWMGGQPADYMPSMTPESLNRNRPQGISNDFDGNIVAAYGNDLLEWGDNRKAPEYEMDNSEPMPSMLTPEQTESVMSPEVTSVDELDPRQQGVSGGISALRDKTDSRYTTLDTGITDGLEISPSVVKSNELTKEQIDGPAKTSTAGKIGNYLGDNSESLIALAGGIAPIATNLRNLRSMKDPSLIEPEIYRPSIKSDWYDRDPMESILSNQLASSRTALSDRGGDSNSYLEGLRKVNFDAASARGAAEIEGQKMNNIENARIDTLLSDAGKYNAGNMTQARIDQAQRQDNVDSIKRDYVTGIGDNVHGIFGDIADNVLAKKLAPLMNKDKTLDSVIASK